MSYASEVSRSGAALVAVVAAGIAAAGLAGAYMLSAGRALPEPVAPPRLASSPAAPAPGVLQARAGKVAEGLLRQTALHLSRMQGGASIGGFPGFEPPEEDEAYRRKIRNRTYDGEDVNDWVKEIGNFLDQILKKNPGRPLREILQRQGLSETEIASFVNALRRAQELAEGLEGHGVNEVTVGTLKRLLVTLGISP